MRQVLKVLDVIMIDTAVGDPTGKKFWRRHFFQRDEVVWKEFECTMWNSYLPSHIHVVTSPSNAALKNDIEKKLRYFRAVLLEMKELTEGSDFVKIDQLGFVLQYFGPLIDGNGQVITFLTRLYETVSQDWFFGTLEQGPACLLLSNYDKGAYLVRYSTSNPGYFTISVRSKNSGNADSDMIHYRIVHEPYTESYTIQGRQYTSLPQLVRSEADRLLLHTAVPTSPYALLRLDEGNVNRSGYLS